jgi:DNA excision repair protein ERCC-1
MSTQPSRPFGEAAEEITRPSSFVPLAPAAPLPSSSPVPPSAPARAFKNPRLGAILVNPQQKGNPLLQHLGNIHVADNELAEDFVLSDSCSALYVSVKFHKLNPLYVGKRMEAMKKKVKTQVLVVHVDDADCEKPLLEVQTLAISFRFVVVLAWSLQEAARYLDAYSRSAGTNTVKLLEGKQASDLHAKAVEVLTTVPAINKNDAKTLMRNFNTMAEIFNASMTDLSILAVGFLLAAPMMSR